MRKWTAAACALALAAILTAVAAAHPLRSHGQPVVTLSFTKDWVAPYVWNGTVGGDATGAVTVVGTKLTQDGHVTLAYVFQAADPDRSFVAHLSGTATPGSDGIDIALTGKVLAGWLKGAHARLAAAATANGTANPLSHVEGTLTIDHPSSG